MLFLDLSDEPSGDDDDDFDDDDCDDYGDCDSGGGGGGGKKKPKKKASGGGAGWPRGRSGGLANAALVDELTTGSKRDGYCVVLKRQDP